MERAVLVYTTWPSVVEAEAAGRKIVERRLAACVNILPGMISHYWWRGAIERAEETVMIVKTRASLAEAVRAAVKEMHAYETPAIMVLPAEGLDPDYHAWIVEETQRLRLSGRRATAAAQGSGPSKRCLSSVPGPRSPRGARGIPCTWCCRRSP